MQIRPDKMILLSLAWFLLTEPFWTSGETGSDIKEILMQEEVIVRYPKILGNETIECDCGSTACDLVFWFRSHISGKVEFLGRCNNADRVIYGDGVDQKRFKFSKKGSNSFGLRIINLTEEDKGIYSCVLREKKVKEIWKPGTLLLPGGLYAKCVTVKYYVPDFRRQVKVMDELSSWYINLTYFDSYFIAKMCQQQDSKYHAEEELVEDVTNNQIILENGV